MATNNFDPTKYGATPFNPSEYGATPITQPKKGIGGLIGADIKIAKAIYNAPKNIVNALSKNEQRLGSNLGQAISMETPAALGGTKGIADSVVAQYLDNGKRALQMAKKETDPTRKAKLVAMAQNNFDQSGATFSQIYPVLDKTDLQLIGDVGGVALDIATSVGVGNAGKLATKTVGLAKGAAVNAGIGIASGATVGAAQGLTGALQEGKTGKDILGQVKKEAIIGGVVGGVLGGITGGISGKLNARDIEKQKNAIKAITPNANELSPTEYEELLKNGQVTPKGFAKPVKINLSNEENRLALQYQNNLQSADPVKNFNSVYQSIDQEDTKITNFLQKNKLSYSKSSAEKYLSEKLADVSTVGTQNNAALKKAKQSLIQNVLDNVPTDANGNFDALDFFSERKNLDKYANKIKAFSGSDTIKKEITKELRNGMQDILSNLPGNETYSETMRKERELFKVGDMILKKAAAEKNLSKITLFIKHHPLTVSTLKWAGAGIGLSAGIDKLVK